MAVNTALCVDPKKQKKTQVYTGEDGDVSLEIQATDEPQLGVVRKKINREYSFFVDYNVGSQKQMHVQREEKQRNVPETASDLINSELAIIANPLTENVITTEEYNGGDYFVDSREIFRGTDEKIKLFNQMMVRLRKDKCFSDWVNENGAFIFDLTTLSPKQRLESMLRNNTPQVVYASPYMISDNSVHSKQKTNNEIAMLDIEFSSLRFKHHALFSLEHILSEYLMDSYIEYTNRNANNILQKIDDDIQINRSAREKVKNELLKLHRSKQEAHLDATVAKYNNRIQELKENFYSESKKNDEIIKRIITLWDDIMVVRKKFLTVNTPLVLEVFKENVSQEELTEIWNEKYNFELMDAIHNTELNYAKQCLEYKKDKYNDKMRKTSGQSKLSKPRLHFDEDKTKQQIEHSLNNLLPKNPKIAFNLKFEDDIVTKKVSDPLEVDRRNLMDGMCYYFRLYVDENFVCQSKKITISKCFSTILSESFSVQILPLNKMLTISLYENEILISKIEINIKHLDKLLVKQHTFQVKEKKEINNYCSGSGNTLQYICKSLDIDLKSTDIIKNKLYTKGQLNVKMGWFNYDESNQQEVNKYLEILSQLNNCLSMCKEFDFNLLIEIIAKICDSQEELNAHQKMLTELKLMLGENSCINYCNTIFHESYMDHNSSRLKLLRYRDMEKFQNLKKSIIPLYSSQISTDQISCLNEKAEFEKYYIPDEQQALTMEPVDLQRYLGAKYIEILNLNISNKIHESLLKPTYEKVVTDIQCWNLRMIFSSGQRPEVNSKVPKFSNHNSMKQELHVSLYRAFCLPDRMKTETSNGFQEQEEGFRMKQLRPFVRISYKEDRGQTTTAIGCNPTWNQTLHLSIGAPDAESGKPTVTIMCPEFNRSAELSVLNINLYDEVKEDVLDDYDSEEPHPNRVYYRLNHRWLGSLQIPLSSVQYFSKMEGAFKINTPPVILGYQSSTDTKNNNNLLHSLYYPILPMQKDAAFITLSISGQPQNSKYRNGSLSNVYSQDVEFLFRHLSDFLTNYSKEFPRRVVSLAYFGTSGCQKCVTQFLQALPLPDIELLQKDLRVFPRRESAMSKSSSSSQARSGDGRRSGPEERGDSANTPRSSDLWTAERDAFEMRSLKKEGNQLDRVIHTCARYVSLIPLYETGCYAVTLMGWELLKILHGSALDHTILLASYFLYLGVKCWIVCGMGLPRGLSSYVLIKYDLKTEQALLTTDNINRKSTSFYAMRQETLAPFIYDAVNGTKYDLRDTCCPLKTVHYVYNDENIWINVQLVETCELVRLDFSHTSDWQPVFNKTISLSKLPRISEQGMYSDCLKVDSLKQRIENKIKTKVQKWRSHRRTIWNRYCSSVLKDSLPHWEYWNFNTNTPKPGPNNRLKQLMSTYKIYGFPLNMPYTNMKQILSSVKSTALFLSEEPSVEFGLAVEIYSYPSSVLSVWIYLASITRS